MKPQIVLLLAALGILAGTVGGALPAGAAGGRRSAQETLWIDAPGYDARIRGVADSTGTVFTSQDYQRLLFVPDRGALAFLFQLKTRELSSVPHSAVRIEEEGAILPPGVVETPLGPFSVNGADIRYEAGPLRLFLGPKPDLVGEISLNDLLLRKPGYRTLSAEYKPAEAAIEAIRGFSKPTEILVFFGTWCHTCSKRLPLLLKTIQEAANPRIRVRYIGVKEDYSEPPDVKAYKVRITPTFIVKVDGTEIGRIEKAPKVSLEQDLAGILSQGTGASER